MEPTDPGASVRGERVEKRHLAILFTDLADSTRLCAAMGAEDFHTLVFDFLRSAAEVVEANGGYVARFMGDGLLAYFGYPVAAEDDSVRAVRAALAIRASVSGSFVDTRKTLAVRSGIATGSVFLGDWLGEGPARERPVVGDAANLAARLQAAAAPDAILVAEATFRLARSAFLFEERAGLALKGIEGTTRAYEVTATAGWDHRPWSGAGSRPMIGRTTELDMLRRELAATRKDATRIVAIEGEAGIGKSTLVGTFLGSLDRSSCQFAAAAANPGSANLPFFLARQYFDDDPFAAGTNDPASSGAEAVVARAIAQLLAERGSAPLVLVAEDLHWADPSSLSFLAALADGVPAGLLLIATSRTPLSSLLPGANIRPIGLARLDEIDMLALVRQETPSNFSPSAAAQIVTRADGIPLFGVELTRHLIEADGLQDASLPWSLSELLAARLSDLGESLRIAQCLAVLGLSGELDILAGLAAMPSAEVAAVAHTLQRVGVARLERGSDGAQRLAFSHALVRDSLYEMLFAYDRKALHRRAAELLGASASNTASFDEIAGHWAAGDEFVHAAATYARAGEAHRIRYGFREAGRAIDLGLAALSKVPATPRRDRIELELQSSLAGVLQISQGYSTAGAQAAAGRVKVLAERQGELTQRFAGLAGQWMAASSAGDYRNAAAAAQQLLAIATSVGGHEMLAAAWMAQLTSRFRMGDLEGAEQAFAAGERHYLTASFLARPGAIAQTYGNGALVAALLGNPAAARTRAALAIRNGRRMKSDYDICFAAYMAGMLCLMLGADPMARRWSARALRLATQNGFPQFAPIAQVVLGRAMAALGEVSAGVETIRSGITAMDATRSRVGLTLYISWLAEAECFAHETDRAALTLERALAANPEERFYRPETLRLKARLLWDANKREEAGMALRQAVDLASEIRGPWFFQRLNMDDLGVMPRAAD